MKRRRHLSDWCIAESLRFSNTPAIQVSSVDVMHEEHVVVQIIVSVCAKIALWHQTLNERSDHWLSRLQAVFYKSLGNFQTVVSIEMLLEAW